MARESSGDRQRRIANEAGFSTYYQYRKAQAQRQGFTGYNERRREAKKAKAGDQAAQKRIQDTGSKQGRKPEVVRRGDVGDVAKVGGTSKRNVVTLHRPATIAQAAKAIRLVGQAGNVYADIEMDNGQTRPLWPRGGIDPDDFIDIIRSEADSSDLFDWLDDTCDIGHYGASGGGTTTVAITFYS